MLQTAPSAVALQTNRPVGLLAGAGRFPLVFAERAKQAGIPVVCVGIREEAPPELIPLVERFHWAGIAKLGRIIRCFKKEGVEQIVMAGKIQKKRLHTPFRIIRYLPDWRALSWWFFRRRRNNSDDSLLLGIIDEGILTRRGLSSREEADVDFGWELAKEMGRLDVGQSVAVRERAVLAVEAIEGTDQAILRAGQLCPRGGFVVVKVAKPQQDMRFDVPTVGIQTIETMHQAGARVLAIEAGRTIILDEGDTVAAADRWGITILARAA
jgi:UDP-2,3-diacylglucosamine hydrolase